MRGKMRTGRLLALVASLLMAASASADGSSWPQAGPRACATRTASGPELGWAHPTFTKLGGAPFGVATSRGYAFVANLMAGLDVLSDRDGAPRLIHTIALPGGQGVGMTITADHRYLLIADGGDGAVVVDVGRAEAGERNAVLGTLRANQTGQSGGGAIEVATSRDGRFAFVSLEGSREIAVYRLAAAIADHFGRSAYVGAIPTGLAPVGLAVSRDGRWLYSTSEIGGPSGARVGGGGDGSLSVISVATAERDPGRGVVATVAAGCQPVRVAISPDGADAWVTARASDELLGFSTAKLTAHATGAGLAAVRVGEAPVGLAVVDRGRWVVVADSNRFGARGANSALTIVDTAAALGHRAAVIGTVKAEQFPREMALEPAGTVLLVSNFGSGTLEAVHVVDHSQDSNG